MTRTPAEPSRIDYATHLILEETADAIRYLSPPQPGAYVVGGIYQNKSGAHTYMERCIWAAVDGSAYAFQTMREVQP